MRAREKHMNDTNREQALGSIVKDAPHVKPGVVETFERPPYYPVLNFERGYSNEKTDFYN